MRALFSQPPLYMHLNFPASTILSATAALPMPIKFHDKISLFLHSLNAHINEDCTVSFIHAIIALSNLRQDCQKPEAKRKVCFVFRPEYVLATVVARYQKAITLTGKMTGPLPPERNLVGPQCPATAQPANPEKQNGSHSGWVKREVVAAVTESMTAISAFAQR